MPSKLHVLLSAYACLPNAGTEPGFGWNCAVHLAERGIKVHVLTVTDGRDQIETYRATHPLPNISFSYVKVPKWLRHTSGTHYIWWQCAAVRIAQALHRALPFDLVHHITYGSIHVPTQLWRLKLPTVFGPVGGGQVTPKSMLGEFGSSRGAEVRRTALTKMLPYSPWHRKWLRKMSVVLVTNSDTLRLAKSFGNVEAQPWFDTSLPLSFYAEGPRTFSRTTGPLRLLWVGRMLPRKALPLTLDILKRVQRPATLTIVGEGIPETEVRRMIADRGLTERVHWAGRRLSYAETREVFLEHDVLLFPSLRDSCGAQLVEAMGLGLPVITLDHHGAKDLVREEFGIKVSVTTPKGVVRDMAAAVDRFADLSGEAKSAMSKAGWSLARTLNYSTGAELLETLYRQIIDKAPTLTAFPLSTAHMRMAAVPLTTVKSPSS